MCIEHDVHAKIFCSDQDTFPFVLLDRRASRTAASETGRSIVRVVLIIYLVVIILNSTQRSPPPFLLHGVNSDDVEMCRLYII